MLHLADKWIWDFWLADTGSAYHVYYLQAPRALGDPDRRHMNANVGHAVSTDLAHWHVLPDALRPGPAGAWDDVATWTGSVIERAGQWFMFYTGLSRAERGQVQRIGLATSSDLETWTKHPANPLIEADDRWYERPAPADRSARAWRDPWVFADGDGNGYHALITARATAGPVRARGVIGHAWSTDLIDWVVLPPVTDPGDFGELEVPQVAWIAGRPFLVFSTGAQHITEERLRDRREAPRGGVYACPGRSPLGPFDLRRDAAHLGDESIYSGRVVVDRAGVPRLLAFINGGAAGGFVGALTDPLKLDVNGSRLVLADTPSR